MMYALTCLAKATLLTAATFGSAFLVGWATDSLVLFLLTAFAVGAGTCQFLESMD